jgi:hypothetical protein
MSIGRRSGLTPSLRSCTRSLTTNSLGSIFVFNLRQSISLMAYKRIGLPGFTDHFVKVFCWTVIHFCCSANAIFVRTGSCSGSTAFNASSVWFCWVGKLCRWYLCLLLRLPSLPSAASLSSLTFVVDRKRIVNRWERLASLSFCKSRRDFAGGVGGDCGKGIEALFTSNWAEKSALQQREPASDAGGVGTPENSMTVAEIFSPTFCNTVTFSISMLCYLNLKMNFEIKSTRNLERTDENSTH